MSMQSLLAFMKSSGRFWQSLGNARRLSVRPAGGGGLETGDHGQSALDYQRSASTQLDAVGYELLRLREEMADLIMTRKPGQASGLSAATKVVRAE